MLRLTACLCVIGLILTACEPQAGSPKARAAYQVDSMPALVIGGDVPDPDYQLDLATSAVRLDDGSIVIATSGTEEIRVYDADGHFMRRIGRSGDGPGEFRGPIRVVQQSTDTLSVYDAGDRRMSIYGDSGVLVRDFQVSPGGRYEFHGGDWLVGDFWVRGLRDSTLRGCVANALSPIPADPTAPFMRVLADPHGSLWLQPARGEDSSRVWQVHDLEGTPLGSVTLPAGEQLLQLDEDFVLTRAIDSIGFESVSLHSMDRRVKGDTWSRCEGGMAPVAAASAAEAEVEVVARELRNFTVAQEMNFAMRGGYAGAVDSVQWSSESGHTLFIEAATPRSWLAVIPLAAGGFCVSSVGALTPEAWSEGGIKCSVPMPAAGS